jgi:hypothetical protein
VTTVLTVNDQHFDADSLHVLKMCSVSESVMHASITNPTLLTPDICDGNASSVPYKPRPSTPDPVATLSPGSIFSRREIGNQIANEVFVWSNGSVTPVLVDADGTPIFQNSQATGN